MTNENDIMARTLVVGAGAMGRGIATVALVAGDEVRLVDNDVDQLTAAHVQIERDLNKAVERGKLDAGAVGSALDRLTRGTDAVEAAADVHLVLEAVVERLEVKQELFRAVEQAVEPDTVLATNTSALSPTAVMSVLERPDRGVGMHFFNPVTKMRLCELVRALQTSPETMDRAEAAAKRMGKETVRVEDAPGFATSRLNALLGNEALRMLEEGVASAEDIDQAARLGLNHPMGPLEMVDLVGLDVRFEVLQHLTETLGERFRPTNLHRKLLAAGRLGRKAGWGVYRYEEPS